MLDSSAMEIAVKGHSIWTCTAVIRFEEIRYRNRSLHKRERYCKPNFAEGCADKSVHRCRRWTTSGSGSSSGWSTDDAQLLSLAYIRMTVIPTTIKLVSDADSYFQQLKRRTSELLLLLLLLLLSSWRWSGGDYPPSICNSQVYRPSVIRRRAASCQIFFGR